MKKKFRMTRNLRRQLFGLLFLMPFIIGFIMFFLIPITRTFFYSFNLITVGEKGGMEFTPVGFQNYIDLFNKEVTSDSKTLANLFADQNMTALTSVPIIVVFSLFMALLANRQFKGRAIVRTIFFLPIVLGLTVVVDMLMMTTGSDITETGNGLFSESAISVFLYQYSGIPRNMLVQIMDVIDNIFELISHAGIQTLIYLTALQSISPSLYEVAKIEGATAYETFWKVTIPTIMHIILFVVVYTIVQIFLESEIAEEAYKFAFEKSKIGIGSALSVVYIFNVLLVLLIVLLVMRKAVKRYE